MYPDGLACLTAIEQRRLYEAREISPVEVLEAQLSRIDDSEGQINALCEQRIEAAVAAAKDSERRYKYAEGVRPLEGITVALKNEHQIPGSETDLGSALLAGRADESASPVSQRILESGAVVHARTNVPAFCIVAFTDSRLYGTTRNPWNPDYTCGGSSGGSAAAVAAGFTTLASGSDGAGSIRMPAAYCGVVGLKASYGRVPANDPLLAMLTCVHNGPIGRSVADCALLYNVLVGPHAHDPVAIAPKVELPMTFGPVAGLKVAVSMDLGYFDVCSDTLKAVSDAVLLLQTAGAIVSVVDLKWDVDVRDTARTQLWFALGRMIRESVGARGSEVEHYVREAIEVSESISADQYVASMRNVGAMAGTMTRLLEEYDVLICPTLAQNKTPATGAESGVEDILQNAMTYPFNVLSRHPCLSIPVAMASHGVPIGLQIIGRSYDELTVMQVGAALEAEIAWTQWQPHQPVSTSGRICSTSFEI